MMKNCTTAESPRDCAGNDSVFNSNIPLAMAYVRYQSWEQTMNAYDALKHGTAFSSLVKPFLGEEVR